MSPALLVGMSDTEVVNAALDKAHLALEGEERVPVLESIVRLEGLLDLTARGADAERVQTILRLLQAKMTANGWSWSW